MKGNLTKSPKFKFFIRLILLWILIFLFIEFSFIYGLDKKAITAIVIIFGFLSQAFSGLLALIGLVPFLGPFLVKILSWPVFITINGLAYIVTFFAVKAGLAKEVIHSRLLVTIFLIGILLGFILGKVL